MVILHRFHFKIIQTMEKTDYHVPPHLKTIKINLKLKVWPAGKLLVSSVAQVIMPPSGETRQCAHFTNRTAFNRETYKKLTLLLYQPISSFEVNSVTKSLKLQS